MFVTTSILCMFTNKLIERPPTCDPSVCRCLQPDVAHVYWEEVPGHRSTHGEGNLMTESYFYVMDSVKEK